MEELRQHIDALTQRLSEKEAEILSLKAELSALAARADEFLMEQRQKAAETSLQATPPPQQAPANPEFPDTLSPEPNMAEEAPMKQEMTPTPAEEPTQEAIDEIAPANHDAILRTIQKLSSNMSIPGSETPEQRFKSKPTLSDRVAGQQLKDLKKSMGINERFLYANELFAGDMEAFVRAVEELNHLESETDAERLLNEELAEKYKWSVESNTVIAFKSLVSRRFA